MVDVRLNGPRHWVLNSVEANANGQTNNYDKIALFGNIEMSLQAQIQSAFSEGDLYTESEVLRTTTYTYLAGNEVYKLINPRVKNTSCNPTAGLLIKIRLLMI